jgi:hypothetical protein
MLAEPRYAEQAGRLREAFAHYNAPNRFQTAISSAVDVLSRQSKGQTVRSP